MTFVYGFLAISLLVATAVSRLDRRLPHLLFFVYGAALSILTLVKPYGSAPDDLNYVELLSLGCTSYSCDNTFSFGRDFVWFLLVSFSPTQSEFLTIKVIATAALLIKLFVLYQLSPNKLYALSVYTFAFYFLHDLTQYRVALALAFFLLAIYFAARSRHIASGLSAIASIGSHIQAAPSALLLLSPKRLNARLPFLATISLLVTLVALGLFPQLSRLTAVYAFLTGQDYDPASDIGKYIQFAEAGGYFDFRNVSTAAIVILLSLWLVKMGHYPIKPNTPQTRALAISRSSVILAFALYVVFASVLDMQNRFFEFFLVPLALVFGNCRHTARNYVVLVILCMSLFVKFHVLSEFFFA